jgi:hypothetical protein
VRQLAVVAAFAGTLVAARQAHATNGALFGEPSDTAALADAVTGRPSGLSAITFNPGALAALDRPKLTLGAHMGTVDLDYQRNGEPAVDMERFIAGYHIAIGTRLPGPAWLRALRVGIGAHLPAQHALSLRAPSRSDEPSSPLYGARAERTAVAGAVSYELFERIGIGAGFTLSPTLQTPTLVSYDARRSDDPDANVLVDLERELELQASATAGVFARVVTGVTMGVAYRQRITTAAQGPNDTRAGSLQVDDRIDFVDYLEPDELAFGVGVEPGERVEASVDVVRASWSSYRTIHNQVPGAHFDDVFNLRVGLAVDLARGVVVRGGYGFEPTPLPPQRGVTNLLDSTRHVAALGGGFDLDALGWAPVVIDGHVRSHLLTGQDESKDPGLLRDVDRDAAGKQIGNLGYPGFSSGGAVFEAGLTFHLYLDGGSDEPAPSERETQRVPSGSAP